MITHDIHSVQSLKIQGIQAFLSLTPLEDSKMQTQTAQHYPQRQNTGSLIAFSLLSGVFLVYAVQSHLVTEAFMVLMSLFFDQFTVKSSSIVPDIALLVFFALATIGALSVIKNHFAVTITGAILAVVAALVWGA